MEITSLTECANNLEVLNNYTSKEVLTQFGLKLNKIKTPLEEIKLIKEKNFLLQNLIEFQMKNRFFFKINSPFKRTCKVCKGTGEIYKFDKKVIDIKCPECNGQGIKEVKCPKCNGAGRFIKRWKGGGGVNVTCKHCKGFRKIKIKCLNCQASGKIKKTVTSHTIKSTTPCTKCKSLGFIPKPKFKKHVSIRNPVLSNTMAIKIKNTLH